MEREALKHKPLIIAALLYIAGLHLIAVLAFFAPHILPYQGWRLDLPPSEPTPYIAERHRYIQWLDANAVGGSVVLLGASHLEGIDPALIDAPVLKYAAGGDTLRNITSRIEDYPNLKSAKAIVLWAGFNDLAHRDADEIAADLPEVMRRLPAEVPIIMISVAPSNVEKNQAGFAALNAAYQPVCETDARCTFVDLTSALASSDGGLAPAFDRGDGIHFNREGYLKIAAAINAQLTELEGN